MIEGTNIVLQLFTDEDLDEYVELVNTYAEQGEFLDARLRTKSSFRKNFEETEGWWSEHRGFLAIKSKDGRLLGGIGFFRPHSMVAGYEVGYVLLRREDRGKGHGSEALRIFSAYLFDLKPIARLQLVTSEENVAARRIAEKCGYVHEGTFPEHAFVRGEYVTSVQYGLLRKDCTPLAEVLAG